MSWFIYIFTPFVGNTATMDVNFSSDLVTTEASGTAVFTVVLDSQPSSSLTFSVSSNNTGEGTVSASSMTFASATWNVPQTVTATGVDDVLVDGEIGYCVNTGLLKSSDTNFHGVSVDNVAITNMDGERYF